MAGHHKNYFNHGIAIFLNVYMILYLRAIVIDKLNVSFHKSSLAYNAATAVWIDDDVVAYETAVNYYRLRSTMACVEDLVWDALPV